MSNLFIIRNFKRFVQIFILFCGCFGFPNLLQKWWRRWLENIKKWNWKKEIFYGFFTTKIWAQSDTLHSEVNKANILTQTGKSKNLQIEVLGVFDKIKQQILPIKMVLSSDLRNEWKKKQKYILNLIMGFSYFKILAKMKCCKNRWLV